MVFSLPRKKQNWGFYRYYPPPKIYDKSAYLQSLYVSSFCLLSLFLKNHKGNCKLGYNLLKNFFIKYKILSLTLGLVMSIATIVF